MLKPIMKSKLPLIFTICILSLYCWSFDLAKIWHFTCETLKLFFSRQTRACYYHGVWAAIGLYKDGYLFVSGKSLMLLLCGSWMTWVTKRSSPFTTWATASPGWGKKQQRWAFGGQTILPWEEATQSAQTESFPNCQGSIIHVFLRQSSDGEWSIFCMQSCQCEVKI